MRRHLQRSWPYLWVAVAVLVTSISWYPGNSIMAGGDVFPYLFLRPGLWTHAFQTWGTVFVGFGSPQYASQDFLMGLAAVILRGVGLSAGRAEWVFMVGLLLIQGLGMVYFMRRLFPGHPFAQALAGLGIVFNLYGAINDGNPVLAFALGFFLWTAGLYLKAVQSRHQAAVRYGILLGLLSIGTSFVFATPPFLAFWFLWLVALAVFLAVREGKRFFDRANLRLHLTFAGLFAALNGWWLYTAYLVLFGSHGVQQTFQGPLNWAWISQRASILNLLTQQSVWSWPQSGYFPWATPYLHGLLHLLLFAPPILALLALFISRRLRRRMFFLVAVIVVSLFVAKGTHPPFSGVNTWMYLHVPGFWLFRDPQVEWSISLLSSLYALAAIGAEWLLMRAASLRRRLPKAAAWVALIGPLLVAISAIGGSGYALAAGTYLPRSAAGMNSAFVQIPGYWYQAANYVDSHANGGRTLMLPNDDFYQMPYTWGYYGTDSLPYTLFTTPTILLSPNNGGYLGPSQGAGDLEATLQNALASNRQVNLAPVLESLGVRFVLLRGDINSNLPGRNILSPVALSAYLAMQPDLYLVHRFGPLALYQVGFPTTTVAYAPGIVRYSGRPGDVVWTGGLLPSSFIWSSLPTTATVGTLAVSAGDENLPLADHKQVTVGLMGKGTVSIYPSSAEVFALRVNTGTLAIGVRTADVKVGGTTVRGIIRTVTVHPKSPESRYILVVDGRDFSIKIASIPVGGEKDLGGITLTAGPVPYTLWESNGRNLIAPGWPQIRDVNAANPNLTFQQARMAEVPAPRGNVILTARDNGSGVTFPLGTLKRGSLYDLSFAYRYEAGLPPQYQLWNNGANKTFSSETFGTDSAQHTFRDVLSLSTPVNLSLYLYAYGTGGSIKTKDSYGHPSLYAFAPISAGEFTMSTNWRTLGRSTGGDLVLTGPWVSSKEVLTDPNFKQGLWGPIFNANGYKSPSKAGLRATVHSGILSLSARQDGVGEGQIVQVDPTALYRLSFEYRNVAGGPPSYEVWQFGPNVASPTTTLSATPGWHFYTTTFRPLPTVQSLQVSFYSYASTHRSINQYRDISLSQIPVGLPRVAVWQGRIPAATSLHFTSPAPWVYGVTIPAGRGGRALALLTQYHPGWAVYAGPPRSFLAYFFARPAIWPHYLVDSFANGWSIPKGASGKFSLVYQPQLNEYLLLVLAVLTVIGTSASLTGQLRQKGLNILRRKPAKT